MSRKKKKNSGTGWKIFVSIMFIAILVMAGLRIHELIQRSASPFIRYDEFGIEIPVEYEIHGIDVSKYQQRINWEQVKEMEVRGIKIGFAFIKATEGITNEDRQFDRNWKNIRKAGLPRGAYHFFLATKSGKLQAKNFISSVNIEPGDLPPVLDVEQTYGVKPALLRERVREWLEEVERHYKVKPILYTNVEFYRQYLTEFEDYPLWVAHYLQKKKPRITRDWQFWQYSETGKVNGIRGMVDFNVFNGDSTEFYNLLIKE